jgi:phosphoglycerate dehydrogenase-like enzyme
MAETVCIIDPIHPVGVERISAAHDVILPERWSSDARLADTTVIVIRTTEIGSDLFARMPNLRLIVKHGAGVDNIDIPAATARGVMVANTPGGNNSTAVAEGAVALMLALLRRVREMDALVRGGRFAERWKVRLGDLTGARVGLIGFGRIARCVATICKAGFGCEVSAHDPLVPVELMEQAGVRPVTLDELMKSDVVSIHVPLTDATRGLVGARELALMAPTAILVNCSRGGIVDERALADALASRRIAGAGIDVFEAEPPPADHPLFGLSNALLSPHVAGVTENGMKDMAMNVAGVIETVVAGAVPETLLNPEALP